MCALALGSRGVPVIVCESGRALARDLRAGTFHPPTLELMAPYGITERMMEIGIPVRHWQIRDRRGEFVAEFDLGLLADHTPYPHRLHLEQHRLTPIQLDLLRKDTDADVRFGHAVTGVEQQGDRVLVHVGANGEQRTIEASWLVGADGGRSAVRKALGIEFEGFTWPEQFLVVSTPHDFSRYGFALNCYIADPVEWIALFKMPNSGPPGLWRTVFPVPDQPEEVVLAPDKVEDKLQRFVARSIPYEVRYKSTYRVHQRVCKAFRSGRVLLAGDAAHLNNPLGAFGLNGSVHAAFNLGEKLAKVARGEADDSLLDKYVRQRRAANVAFVQAQSIRNKQVLEEKDPAVRQHNLDELRAIAADPVRHKEYVVRSSMIWSVRHAASIE